MGEQNDTKTDKKITLPSKEDIVKAFNELSAHGIYAKENPFRDKIKEVKEEYVENAKNAALQQYAASHNGTYPTGDAITQLTTQIQAQAELAFNKNQAPKMMEAFQQEMLDAYDKGGLKLKKQLETQDAEKNKLEIGLLDLFDTGSIMEKIKQNFLNQIKRVPKVKDFLDACGNMLTFDKMKKIFKSECTFADAWKDAKEEAKLANDAELNTLTFEAMKNVQYAAPATMEQLLNNIANGSPAVPQYFVTDLTGQNNSSQQQDNQGNSNGGTAPNNQGDADKKQPEGGTQDPVKPKSTVVVTNPQDADHNNITAPAPFNLNAYNAQVAAAGSKPRGARG